MSGDRVGDWCWVEVKSQQVPGCTDWAAGRLLAWSTDHEEYESGPGHFPVGVVEMVSDGSVQSVPVVRIAFGELPPR